MIFFKSFSGSSEGEFAMSSLFIYCCRCRELSVADTVIKINLDIFCSAGLTCLFSFLLICFHFQAPLLPLDDGKTGLPRVRLYVCTFLTGTLVSPCVCQALHSNNLLPLGVHAMCMLVLVRQRKDGDKRAVQIPDAGMEPI